MFVGWRIFAIIETGRGSVMQRWRWLCIGANGESREADRGFATVLACRADAFKHGLNPDTPVQVAPLTSQLDCLVASATMDGATPTSRIYSWRPIRRAACKKLPHRTRCT
jgi:hypothetical protein